MGPNLMHLKQPLKHPFPIFEPTHIENHNDTAKCRRRGCSTSVGRVVTTAEGYAGPEQASARLVCKVEVHPPWDSRDPGCQPRAPRATRLHGKLLQGPPVTQNALSVSRRTKPSQSCCSAAGWPRGINWRPDNCARIDLV